MTFPDIQGQPQSSYLPRLKDEGIDFLAATNRPGVSIQVGTIAQAGGTPFATTFAAMTPPMADMADTNYAVFVNGPNGDENANPTTYTRTGFSIRGGADTEVHRVVVVGRVKGQSAP